MESIKFKSNCLKHPDCKIEYIRITQQNQLEQQQQTDQQIKPLFVCQYCFTKDQKINLNDYISIKYILKSGNKEFIPSWPPINKTEIIKDLFSLIGGYSNQQNETIQKIISFFTNLKLKINETIDICQKNMIQSAKEIISQKNEDILKQYQEISKINVLTAHLLNNNLDINEKEKSIEDLFLSLNNSKIEQDLEQLIINNSQNIIYNSETACVIQEQIVQTINNIELFKIVPNIIQPKTINLNLEKTNYKDGENRLQISLNDKQQQEISLIKELNDEFYIYYTNIVSNIILDINKKYIIRIKIDNLQDNNNLYIGLMKQININDKPGWSDKLCCELSKQDNIISLYKDDNGIEKQLQGDKFELSNENEVEIRICIKDQIVHVLDYPSYKYRLGLEDKNIQKLMKAQNLLFYIGLRWLNNKVTLIDVLEVESFD